MPEKQTPQQKPEQTTTPESPLEPILDLSFTRSQRDMIYVSLVVALLALGLSIVLFVNTRNNLGNIDRTSAGLRAEVEEKLAAYDSQVKSRLDQMQEELTADARQAIAQMEGRVKQLESRISEVVQLPGEVRASMRREMILDLQKRSQLLASQLQGPEDHEALQRIQELLKSLERDI